MHTETLVAEIKAVTEEEIAAALLEDETDGVLLKAPITDFFLKQLVTLYRRSEQRCVDEDIAADPDADHHPVDAHAEYMRNWRVRVLGTLLDYELEARYGQCISEDEREEGVILEVRAGWRVWKLLCKDMPAEELQGMLDETPAEKPGRLN